MSSTGTEPNRPSESSFKQLESLVGSGGAGSLVVIDGHLVRRRSQLIAPNRTNSDSATAPFARRRRVFRTKGPSAASGAHGGEAPGDKNWSRDHEEGRKTGWRSHSPSCRRRGARRTWRPTRRWSAAAPSVGGCDRRLASRGKRRGDRRPTSSRAPQRSHDRPVMAVVPAPATRSGLPRREALRPSVGVGSGLEGDRDHGTTRRRRSEGAVESDIPEGEDAAVLGDHHVPAGSRDHPADRLVEVTTSHRAVERNVEGKDAAVARDEPV